MTERATTAPSIPSDRQRCFLLAVDSDANHLFYAAMLLQRFEYKVCTAKAAEEALDITSVALPALIITDMNLTGMGGLELARRIKADPRTAAIPVVATTLNRTPSTEMQCDENGCVACIRKPIQAEELYRTVQAAIETTPRNNIRIFTRLPVTVNNVLLNYAEGECVSVLSQEGLYIRTLKPHPEKALVYINLFINGHGVSAETVVLYNHTFGEGPYKGPGMGLQFTQIMPRDREVIRKFIRDEITRGIKPF